MRPLSARTWLLLGLVLHLALQLRPAVDRVWNVRHGRDFASYYYAVQVAAEGHDPYVTARLDDAARRDRTRKTVNPYFYPPPFLLAMAWAIPLDLTTAYRVMLGLNELLLAGCLWLTWWRWKVASWAIALVLAAWSPIPDNAWMGQANLVALLPALAGLALADRRPVLGGALVGVAAMFKMSPALFLGWWLLRRRWMPVAAAIAAAVALSVLALPLVGWEAQLRFYREVLPGFGVGDYHGLSVPISLPANHSIPDLFDRLWPGPNPTRLSDAAVLASRLVTVALLALWAARVPRLDAGPALGALTVLMVVIPAYTYEHHLVFLLLPILVAVSRGPPWAWVPIFFFLAWPLEWLRWTQKQLPALDGWWRESKFLAEAGLFLLLLYGRRMVATQPAA